jgi:hypothetical protein
MPTLLLTIILVKGRGFRHVVVGALRAYGSEPRPALGENQDPTLIRKAGRATQPDGDESALFG